MYFDIAVGHAAEACSLSYLLPQHIQTEAMSYSGNRRRNFLGARVLLSLLLKNRLGDGTLSPIETARYGKPYFVDRKVFFNITNSSTTVAVAISDAGEVGVDLEFLKARHNVTGLKERILGDGEKRIFSSMDEAKQLELFTCLWTVRECTLKISGRGLGGLSNISISLEEKNLKCSDNRRGSVSCVRFDSLLEGRPSFFSYGGEFEKTRPEVFSLKGGKLLGIEPFSPSLELNINK